MLVHQNHDFFAASRRNLTNIKDFTYCLGGKSAAGAKILTSYHVYAFSHRILLLTNLWPAI